MLLTPFSRKGRYYSAFLPEIISHDRSISPSSPSNPDFNLLINIFYAFLESRECLIEYISGHYIHEYLKQLCFSEESEVVGKLTG